MLSKARLLVIDRNLQWLRFAKRTLQCAGYAVAVAMDLVEAFRVHPDNDFDLVLIGLDQVERNLSVFAQLSREKAQSRRFVVMFPIHRTLDRVRVAFRAGAYDCIDKPFEAEALLDLVSEQLTHSMQTATITEGIDLSDRIQLSQVRR
jgi:DNA-binding NtrC family response regulator